MREQIEGSQAVARAVAACRPQAICAYPITPQTHIVEAIGVLVRSGKLKSCEFINVESEFAAMSVAIGASATGPVPIQRPPVRGCCTWSRRSTTPPVSGSRSS